MQQPVARSYCQVVLSKAERFEQKSAKDAKVIEESRSVYIPTILPQSLNSLGQYSRPLLTPPQNIYSCVDYKLIRPVL